MKIKLSYRDLRSDTKDIWHNQSETDENFPKNNHGIVQKPQVDTRIHLDPERTEIDLNLAMPLNVRNQLFRNKK